MRDAVEGERERRDLAVAGDLAQIEIELGQPVRLADLWLGLGLGLGLGLRLGLGLGLVGFVSMMPTAVPGLQ